jgi:hypothetical protein
MEDLTRAASGSQRSDVPGPRPSPTWSRPGGAARPFLVSPRFRGDLAWVAAPRRRHGRRLQDIGPELVRKQLEFDFKAELLRPIGRPLERLWDDLWRLLEILETEPVTLLHGDPHIGNTYVLPDGRGGLLDWQLMVRGRWAHDLTYLMVTGLTPEDRGHTSGRSPAISMRSRRVSSLDAEAAWLPTGRASSGALRSVGSSPRRAPARPSPQPTSPGVAAAQDLETFRLSAEPPGNPAGSGLRPREPRFLIPTGAGVRGAPSRATAVNRPRPRGSFTPTTCGTPGRPRRLHHLGETAGVATAQPGPMVRRDPAALHARVRRGASRALREPGYLGRRRREPAGGGRRDAAHSPCGGS